MYQHDDNQDHQPQEKNCDKSNRDIPHHLQNGQQVPVYFKIMTKTE